MSCQIGCDSNNITPESKRYNNIPLTPAQKKLLDMFGDKLKDIPEAEDILAEMERLSYLDIEPTLEKFVGLGIKIETPQNDSQETSAILPPADSVPVEDFIDVNEEIENLTDAVAEGDAFQNQLELPCQQSESYLTNFENTYNSTGLYNDAVAQYTANPVGRVPSVGEFDSFFAKIATLKTAIANLRSHSNIFSGVDMSGDFNLAYIMRVMVDSRRNKGFEGCSLTGDVFGVIRDTFRYIQELQSLLSKFAKFLNSIPTSFDELMSLMESLAQNIVDSIQRDLAAFLKAELRGLQKALGMLISSFFDDECMGEIFSIISTPKVNEITSRISRARITI